MNPFKVLRFCPKCGKSEWQEVMPNMRVCKICAYENYKNPTIGASGLVFDDRGRLLVVRRAKDPAKGTLDIPGGFCEVGEKVEDAVKREIFEETGIVVEATEFLFDLPNDYEYRGIDLYPLDFFFKCKLIDMSRIKLDLKENSEILFISPSELNPDDFGLLTNRQAIKLYFNK